MELIVGLEVHVELNTVRKMFCSCDARWFGKQPNTHVCPVCLGMPGALPVPNREAILWTARIALALNCSINENSYFERKHYFYPDLPKGYQISQYKHPIGYEGYLDVPYKGKTERIAIERVHLEEDTGKLSYATDKSGARIGQVDFNRSGVPLVEIVTHPVIHDPELAAAYLKQLRMTILHLGVSDVDMEKGSMRCEPNISVRPSGQTKLPSYKVEVKNINSFRFVKKA
ncbi:MAG: Asp-tRNA(Asn)/Glu-tRNA(Gln) amidotransferase subunit GatB, partial [Candidatus Roizmanbacteria bacterium]|nr:Asp-tRNA(Asn)/Glu-tRNA(Gln) amidotransferase subunit GatB [Candidatus Roizmanbacteria bacterium]